MKERFLCSLVSIFMLVTLAACSTGGTDASPGANSESNSGQQNSAEGPGAVPDSEPAVEAVEIVSEELQKYTDALDNSCAAYIAELKNTGTTAIQLNDISIDVEKADGTLLTTAELVSAYPNIIAPGETAYICEEVVNGFSFENGIALEDIGTAILHYSVQEHDAVEPLPVSITEAALGESYGSLNLTGRITNDGDADLENVCIAAAIRDANGMLQNVIFTIVESLSAGETKGFEQMSLCGDMSLDFSASTVDASTYLLW